MTSPTPPNTGTPATTAPDESARPEPPPDAFAADPAADSLDPRKELPRFFGLAIYAVLSAGVAINLVIAILAALFSLFYFAALFAVLFFLSLGGVLLVEFIRLRGWRYSVREMLAGWLGLFLIGIVCVGLGYKQYRLTWSDEKPLEVTLWHELSLAQRHVLAEELVHDHIHPTLADLIDWRNLADLKPRDNVWNNRKVQEFGFFIGPWKLLGRECLVVRIDSNRNEPIYTLEIIEPDSWR